MRKIGVVYRNALGSYVVALPNRMQRLRGKKVFSNRIEEAKVFYPNDVVEDGWHQILDDMDAVKVEVSINIRVLGDAK